MSHPHGLIARVKGLMLCGLSAKAVASLAGVSYYTVRDWQSKKRHGDIEPDLSVRRAIANAIRNCGHAPCETALALGRDTTPSENVLAGK
jgi:transcriptional regulator with XRE-family HTH domain